MSKRTKKIAALKAIREQTLAQMAATEPLPPIEDQELEADEDFPPHEDIEKDYFPKKDNYNGAENVDDGSWHAVSTNAAEEPLPLLNIEFNGKNLENGQFNNENLQDANFSFANLSGVNFSGSDLRGADFSNANLTNTDLSNADLSGATFSQAQLIGTNFTGAIMNNVVLTDAVFQDAILLDIEADDLTIEELQQLIEFVAKYYPHKLDLTKINLTMLDLKKIDLRRVSLRGVDFSGVDFTGVNIMELDLSSCIITPEQIAQALGHPPTPIELKKILAPKKNKKKIKGLNIDLTELFLGNNKEFGVWHVGGFKGMSSEDLVKIGKKIYTKIHHKNDAPAKDKEALEYIREQNRANKEELRQVIEERKRRELENRKRERQQQNSFNKQKSYER